MAKSLSAKPQNTTNSKSLGAKTVENTTGVTAKSNVVQESPKEVNEAAIENFVSILKSIVEPFAIVSEDVVKKNIDLACGHGMSADDRTISFECAEYLMANFAYIIMGLVLDNQFKDTFMDCLKIELQIDSKPEDVVKKIRDEMKDHSEYKSIGSIVIGITGFTPATEERFMNEMSNGYAELDRYADEFDAAVDKLTNEQKLELGFIFSNFMYLIRAFTHNDYFMSYVVTVIEKVKATIGIINS
jgi:RNAse (barnase) inhibitor barstar